VAVPAGVKNGRAPAAQGQGQPSSPAPRAVVISTQSAAGRPSDLEASMANQLRAELPLRP